MFSSPTCNRAFPRCRCVTCTSPRVCIVSHCTELCIAQCHVRDIGIADIWNALESGSPSLCGRGKQHDRILFKGRRWTLHKSSPLSAVQMLYYSTKTSQLYYYISTITLQLCLHICTLWLFPLEGRVDGRAVQTLTASVQFNVIWGMYVFPQRWPQDGQ